MNLKQIQEAMDYAYKSFRQKHIKKEMSYEELMAIKDAFDMLANELNLIQQKNGKSSLSEENADENMEGQLRMIKALKMNDPLWSL